MFEHLVGYDDIKRCVGKRDDLSVVKNQFKFRVLAMKTVIVTRFDLKPGCINPCLATGLQKSTFLKTHFKQPQPLRVLNAAIIQ
jgi:hypothetical protein